ncbi:MAG: hypothetical protein HY727_05250 [Candidatus Rokubacteria bacterium]|nr:hypothetical protein [Candidatus Rokubacteria bacterium]
MAARLASDGRWIPAFRARYASWWETARPLIAEHQYGPAFKTYPWPTFEDAPWTPVAKPLRESRVAIVTTGGLYRPSIDRPFDGEALEGDPSFRAIPARTDPTTLAIAHPHFNHEVARADMNTIFPLERLGELRAEGAIGSVAATHYSTMGYVTRAADLAEETAPAIALAMRAEAVDVALIVPV